MVVELRRQQRRDFYVMQRDGGFYVEAGANDGFFELGGNWPDWLTLYARGLKVRR